MIATEESTEIIEPPMSHMNLCDRFLGESKKKIIVQELFRTSMSCVLSIQQLVLLCLILCLLKLLWSMSLANWAKMSALPRLL